MIERDSDGCRIGARKRNAWQVGGPRVRVTDRQLRRRYGALDRLVAHKKQIEQELFWRLRHLFALKVDLVFYDLTATHFESNGPAGLAQYGYSRDSMPRHR